jgi:hypothetical protein
MKKGLGLALAFFLSASAHALQRDASSDLADRLGTEDYTLLVNSGWAKDYVRLPEFDSPILLTYGGRYRTTVGLACYERREKICREAKVFTALFIRSMSDGVELVGVSLAQATLVEEDFPKIETKLHRLKRKKVRYNDGGMVRFHLTENIGNITESQGISIVLLVPAVVVDLVFQIPLLAAEIGGVSARKVKFARASKRLKHFIFSGKRYSHSSVKLAVDLKDYELGLAKPLFVQTR